MINKAKAKILRTSIERASRDNKRQENRVKFRENAKMALD